MKIAVFHNYLDNIGGAEMVTLLFQKEFNADIYTTNINREKIERMGFDTKRVHSIGRIPIQAPFRQQKAYSLFKRVNLTGKYDLFIIAGDWAMSAAVRNHPNIWYVHSPTREIWDLYRYVRKNNVQYGRIIFDLWVSYHRFNNIRNVNHVDRIVAVSDTVRKRVRKYLRRDAVVINPPTDIRLFKYRKHRGYWLSVNRLINHKRVELQLEAFRRMPKEKLIIVGSYEDAAHFNRYVRKIMKIKPPNVEIKHWIKAEELRKLYSECKGFITTSIREDFGLTAVEAMASGKPVIAPNEGGYKETVIHGMTGILIDNITPGKIMKAVKKLSNNVENFREACSKQSEKFSKEVWIEKMKTEIKKALNKRESQDTTTYNL